MGLRAHFPIVFISKSKTAWQNYVDLVNSLVHLQVNLSFTQMILIVIMPLGLI